MATGGPAYEMALGGRPDAYPAGYSQVLNSNFQFIVIFSYVNEKLKRFCQKLSENDNIYLILKIDMTALQLP